MKLRLATPSFGQDADGTLLGSRCWHSVAGRTLLTLGLVTIQRLHGPNRISPAGLPLTRASVVGPRSLTVVGLNTVLG